MIKMEEKKNIKKIIIQLFGLTIGFSILITMVYLAFVMPMKWKEKVVKIEQREVLDGSYVNIDGMDYILLQIKYDEYSKLEKYLIYDIVFKDVEDVEKPYIKLYLNKYDRPVNSELYY